MLRLSWFVYLTLKNQYVMRIHAGRCRTECLCCYGSIRTCGDFSSLPNTHWIRLASVQTVVLSHCRVNVTQTCLPLVLVVHLAPYLTLPYLRGGQALTFAQR